LFLPGSSCVALLLQICLINSSLSMVGQLSFECHVQSLETGSGIHWGPTLGSWLVTPHLLSAFVTCPALVHLKFRSLPHPHSLKQVQCSIPSPLSELDYNSLFIVFSFVQEGVVHFVWGYTWSCSQGMGRGVMCGSCHSLIGSAGLHKQLWNQLARRHGVLLFSRQTLTGTSSAWWDMGRLSMG
jgi:hypothetical protein